MKLITNLPLLRASPIMNGSFYEAIDRFVHV